MTPAVRTGWDPLAASAAVIALSMMAIYLVVIRGQGNDVALWFVGALGGAAALGLYGAARGAPHRGSALAVSGLLMAVLGLLGILSIGAPILIGALMALVAARRS